MRLALYKAKLGETQAATALLKRADSLKSADIDSQLTKGRTLELLGRRGEALEILKTCLASGATTFQISSEADLQKLIQDPRYKKILQPNS